MSISENKNRATYCFYFKSDIDQNPEFVMDMTKEDAMLVAAVFDRSITMMCVNEKKSEYVLPKFGMIKPSLISDADVEKMRFKK